MNVQRADVPIKTQEKQIDYGGSIALAIAGSLFGTIIVFTFLASVGIVENTNDRRSAERVLYNQTEDEAWNVKIVWRSTKEKWLDLKLDDVIPQKHISEIKDHRLASLKTAARYNKMYILHTDNLVSDIDSLIAKAQGNEDRAENCHRAKALIKRLKHRTGVMYLRIRAADMFLTDKGNYRITNKENTK